MPRFIKETKLDSVRKPTSAESKRGADVVFERSDASGRAHVILACRCYEGWEQWGAPAEVLADNCDAVECWRRGGIAAFDAETE